MEHRWGERFRASFDVRLWDRSYRPVRGQTTNLSCSGAFVRTEQPLTSFTHLFVELDLPLESIPKRPVIGAYVVRTVPEGVALEWCEPLTFDVRSLLMLPRDVSAVPPAHRSNAG